MPKLTVSEKERYSKTIRPLPENVIQRLRHESRRPGALRQKFDATFVFGLLATLDAERNANRPAPSPPVRKTSKRTYDRTRCGNSSIALPPMQYRIFRDICRGKHPREIATELKRSVWTINNHLKAVYKTFGVRSRAALVAKAYRENAIPL